MPKIKFTKLSKEDKIIKKQIIEIFDISINDIKNRNVKYYKGYDNIWFVGEQKEDCLTITFNKIGAKDRIKISQNVFNSLYYLFENIYKMDVSKFKYQNTPLYYSSGILDFENGLILKGDKNIQEFIDMIQNPNSIQFLEYQNTQNIRFGKSFIMINTLRNWKYSKHIFFYGSITLYLMGLRECNDIDGIFTNDKHKQLDFTDFCPNTPPSNFKGHLDNVALGLGDNFFTEIIQQKKHRIDYLGFKLLSIQGEIIKRQLTNRPRRVADILMLDRIGIQIPKLIIPNETKYSHRIINRKKFVKTIQWILNKRYRVYLSPDMIETYLIFKKPKQGCLFIF